MAATARKADYISLTVSANQALQKCLQIPMDKMCQLFDTVVWPLDMNYAVIDTKVRMIM